MRNPRQIFFGLTCLLILGQSPLVAQEIPEDLLDDEHVREEFGVNKFTAPSIGKIFEDLQSLRPLPYEELRRLIPEKTPTDRTKLALAVGLLLADGFFAVEAEQFGELEPVGRSLLKHAEVLGAGTRISRHTKSLLEHGADSDWDGLKKELARTQKDVENEMVLIRDVDAANLISLGGWLRAFEIGCAASLNPFDPKKAQTLLRPDVVEYFILNLETLEPRLQDEKVVTEVTKGLDDLQKRLELDEGVTLQEKDVQELRILIEGLVDLAYGTQLVAKSGIPVTEDKPVAVKKPATKEPTEVKPATGGVITGEVKD